MKTDRFSDIIRRKLESIRPEFTEKDWTRMQSTLHQAGPFQPGSSGTGQPFGGSVWSSHPWLMAAASVGTAALISFSIWQRSEINELQKTVGQLKQKSDSTQVTPISPELERPALSQTDATSQPTQNHESTRTSTQTQGLSGQRDTVYITRYVPEPSRSRFESTEERANHQEETRADQRYAETGRAPVLTGSSRQRNDLNTNQKTDSYGVSSTPLTSDKNTSDFASPTLTGTTNAPLTGEKTTPYSSLMRDKESNQLVGNTRTGRSKNGRGTKRNNLYDANSFDNQRIATESQSTNAVTPNKNSGLDKAVVPTEQSVAATGTAATYELATSRSLSTKTVNWSALMAQRSKRIRQAWTPAVVEQATVAAAPESQPTPRLGTQFRLGVGGELAASSQNFGAFSEVLLGKHWSLGIGFVKATYTNKFTSDDDFYDRTHREFKNAFGPGIDQFREIYNIDTHQARNQIPISLGYRIPLNTSLTLLSSVGTSLNLSNSENVTFVCRLPLPPFQQNQGKYAFGQVDINKQQPIGLINSLALGAGLEWHSRHWALQGTPALNIPVQSATSLMQPDQNWQQKATVSLRARLLYQF